VRLEPSTQEEGCRNNRLFPSTQRNGSETRSRLTPICHSRKVRTTNSSRAPWLRQSPREAAAWRWSPCIGPVGQPPWLRIVPAWLYARSKGHRGFFDNYWCSPASRDEVGRQQGLNASLNLSAAGPGAAGVGHRLLAVLAISTRRPSVALDLQNVPARRPICLYS
jgi:hypothetical protein